MKRQMLTLLFAAGVVPPASANEDINAWFDARGQPTERAQVAVTKANLPRLVEGVTFIAPRRRANMLGEPGCITLQLEVRADGLTDNFLVLDSKPKGFFDDTVLQSVRVWKFEPSANAHSGIIEVGFDVLPVGSHVPKQAHCLVPKVTLAEHFYPAEPAVRRDPFYPPAQVEARAQGCVSVAFTVRPDGLADDYDLIDAQPGQAFVGTVIKALNGWKFPKAGKPARAAVRYAFELPGDVAAPRCKPLPGAATATG